MLSIRGNVPLFPTEDPEKVRSSILNLFPISIISSGNECIEFRTDNVEYLVSRITELQIRDTSVMIMETGLKDDSTSFYLNKQAALMGVVNFTEGGSTLGDIEVEVISGATDLIGSIRPMDLSE